MVRSGSTFATIASRCSTRALILCLVVLGSACRSQRVDRALVGTWDIQVPNASGMARWVWEIRADGTYDFHAEGPASPPSHSGTFTASRGHYTLISTTIAWNDTGTYQLVDGNDTMVATGRLGTGSWHRVEADPASPAPPSLTSHLAGHLTVTDFWEHGEPDDHVHRSNIDGTVFERDSRRISFVAKADFLMAQAPKLDDLTCVIASASAASSSNVLDLHWMEEGPSATLSLIGGVGPLASGQWAPGNYTFTCSAPDGPFIARSFTVE
jgi:hypothetical protein